MKNFKKGDKVTLISNDKIESESKNWANLDGLKIGRNYTVSRFSDKAFGNESGIEIEGKLYWHPCVKFKLSNKNHHPLIITPSSSPSKPK